MKTGYSLILLLIISAYSFGQENFTWSRDYKQVVDTDTLFYQLQNKYFFANAPNLIKLDPRSGKIKDINVPNGRIKKLKDNIYEVYPDKPGEIKLNIITNKVFQLKHIVTILPNPYAVLINHRYPELNFNRFSPGALYLGTLSDNRLIAKWDDYTYRITEFTISTVIQGFVKEYKSNSDTFSSSQISLIQAVFNDRGTKAKFYIQDIKTIGPDSIIRNSPTLICKVYDNYLDAFVNNLNSDLPLQNNLRIKITGEPTSNDIQNVNNIVLELDQLAECISVKTVNSFPSIVLNFDSISPSSYRDRKQSIKFLPSHAKTTYHDLLYEPEPNRASVLLAILTKKLIDIRVLDEENSIYNYDFDRQTIAELSNYDKKVLQLAFSKEGYEKLTKKHFLKNKKEFPGKLLLSLLLSLFFILVAIEITQTYHLLSAIKYRFLKNIISYLIISQLVFASLLLVFGKEMLEIEKQLIPFSILTGLLFYLADRIISKIKLAWIILLTETLFSLSAIVISYSIVYLFTMGELVKLKIHNENIFLILVSVVVVRLLIRYQIIKVGHVIKEKDIKISRQNELLLKSQLNAIQARINPHFLYNSLNSLAELSKIDADRTEKMALSLSKLFQYNINRDNEMSIKLSEEIKMVRLYLSIEKQRFSDKLDYEIVVEDQLFDILIPKFLLQPLVENAVKHGISKITGKGTININIVGIENKISIKIFDNGPDFPEGIINGYGLQNSYEKLDLIYQKPYEIRFINGKEKHIWLLLNK